MAAPPDRPAGDVPGEGSELDAIGAEVHPNADGLVPCVVQDVRSRAVLMVAWVNRAALAATVDSGFATYWSRSRGELWEKGKSSGNRQSVLGIRLDCDGDTIHYLVDPSGPACHLGTDTCFSHRRVGGGWRWEPERVLSTDGVARQTYLSDLERLADHHRASSTDPAIRSLVDGGVSIQAAALKEDAERLAHALSARPPSEATEAAAVLIQHLGLALRGRGVGFHALLEAISGTFEPPTRPRPGPENSE